MIAASADTLSPMSTKTLSRSRSLTHLRRRRLASTWNGRVDSWHDHVSETPAFDLIRRAVLDVSGPLPGRTVIDLGAGTGFLTLPLARAGADVIAVDLSAAMIADLERRAAAEAVRVDVAVADIAEFDFPADSADLVVSNYALHHLSHAQKQAVLANVNRWLRPGGRVVIADMMFGRGGTAHDRRVLRTKVRQLLAKGPGGVWRVAKNLVRFGLGVGSERPASPGFWTTALTAAGFADVAHRQVIAEAGIVTAAKQPSTDGGSDTPRATL